MTDLAADPTAALCTYLSAELAALVATTPTSGHGGQFKGPFGVPAIFRPDLPRGFDELMPTACIVVRPAGGYQLYGAGKLPVADPRIELLCFGDSQLQAQNIARTAAIALKALGPSQYDHVLLHWARITGGPLPLPDPETLWPTAWLSVQVMHAEVALA